MCTHMCMYAHVCACWFVHPCVYASVCTCTCMCVHMHMCVCICMCVCAQNEEMWNVCFIFQSPCLLKTQDLLILTLALLILLIDLLVRNNNTVSFYQGLTRYCSNHKTILIEMQTLNITKALNFWLFNNYSDFMLSD